MFFKKRSVPQEFSFHPNSSGFKKDSENVQKKKLKTNETKQSSEKSI